jgi:glycosyltransferase involved in cell wall biosynthesis
MIHRISASILALLPVFVSRSIVKRTVSTSHDESDSPKQLLIDISEVIRHDARTGIQRVVRGIVQQLFLNPPSGYVVRPVFAERNRNYHYAPVTIDCLQADEQKRHNALPVRVKSGDVFVGLDLAAHVLPRHQGQLLRWKQRGVRLSFLVYDLLPLLHPQWFNPKRYKTFSRWLRTLAVYSDDLICISEIVKTDLIDWFTVHYGLSESVVGFHTIPLGSDIAATLPSNGCTDDERSQLETLRARAFVFMVGTLEPRKGYTLALDAFEELWKNNIEITLVIVGKPGWNTDTLQVRLRTHIERNLRLFWFDNASDELLDGLYRTAKGVLLASEGEGFGLPLIEAEQHRKPILARDIPVFREIAGRHTVFYDADSFVHCLENWVYMIQSCDPVQFEPRQTSWAESADNIKKIVMRTDLHISLGMMQ